MQNESPKAAFLQNQNNNTNNENDVIDLLPVFLVVWRKKWTIMTLVILTMILTALVVLSIEPTYRSTATMQIEQQEAQVVSIEQIYGVDSSSEYLQTQFELLKSRTLAERVVRELELTTHIEFDPRQAEPPLIDIKGLIANFNLHSLIPGTTPEDFVELPPPTEDEIFTSVVDSFIEKITIAPIKKSQLVKISVDMHDSNMATRAANAIAQNFINSQLDAAMETSMTATNWMNERLVELRDNLQVAENKLQEFKEQQGLIDVGGSGIVTVSANELSAINERLVDARTKTAEAKSQYKQVKSIKKWNWRKMSTVPAVLSHPLVQTFKAEEAKAQAKVKELSKRYGKRHPTMQAANSDLTAAQESLKAQVLQIVAGIERQYQIATANEASLQESVEENKAQIQDISKNEFKLRELQREVDSNRTIYDTFMDRLKETTATADLESAKARIVDPAIMPTKPIKPKKGLIVIIAGFLAGLFAVFLTLLLNALNNTFKSTDEIESKLNLPVLGLLPIVKANTRRMIVEHYIDKTDKPFMESVKTIRTGIMLSGIDNPHKVLVVTSSIPGEGKTTVSTNLAISLGEMENTLLIEADMRRPTMAKTFDLPVGTPGLANLIANTADYDDCIQSIGGIDLIVAGLVPPNPLELIASKKFAEVMEELINRYERIVIDCPPVQAVSDALVLSKYAENLIYVIKAESTSKPVVTKGIGQLLQNNAPVKGVVLNTVDIKKGLKYGYGYDGYYDYYGYSTK